MAFPVGCALKGKLQELGFLHLGAASWGILSFVLGILEVLRAVGRALLFLVFLLLGCCEVDDRPV